MSASLLDRPAAVRELVVVVIGGGDPDADPAGVVHRFEEAVDDLGLDVPVRWLIDDHDGTLEPVGDLLWRAGEQVSTIDEGLSDARRHDLLAAAADAVVVVASPESVPERVLRTAVSRGTPVSVQYLL